MWRKLRVVILLLILATVAQQAWLKDGAPDWHRALYVTLYPINADGSEAAAAAVESFKELPLERMDDYFSNESASYHVALSHPFSFRAGAPIATQPPEQPKQSIFGAMLWSLQFRWWAWRHTPDGSLKPDIRLYLLYFDPALHPVLTHSSALSKGRIGIVKLFASRSQRLQNEVVIAHELLHTVGAIDKYDLSTTLPLFPNGYAAPQQEPLYPQHEAELMAGRRPLSAEKAEIPDSLSQTTIGSVTAKEIGWIK